MPTTRPRHQVTETPEVAEAIDRAAQRWPGEPRSRLLLRLVAAGSDAIDAELDQRRSRHREAVERTKGKFAGAFGPGYLDELRKDWPE